MTTQWQDFLTQAGAVHQGIRIQTFGDPAAESRQALDGNVICDLSHLGLIRADGPDAQALLQGQFTNDVRRVAPDKSQFNAHCTPKGRMLTCFRLFMRGNAYYMRLPRELLEPLLKKLRLYVLRSQVSLSDASDTLARLGLSGPAAASLVQDTVGMLPVHPDDVVQHHQYTVIRLPGLHPRFEIHGETQAMTDLWLELAPQAKPVGAEPWRLLDILAGVPVVYADTAEAFVPQMANLHLLNGVSFRKGCYTGQEVVARTQYLGKLKRRMYRFHADTGQPPLPGTPLSSPRVPDSQGAGRVVDAAPHPDGGFEVLAVALMECAEQNALTLPDGTALRQEPLPYPFEMPKG